MKLIPNKQINVLIKKKNALTKKMTTSKKENVNAKHNVVKKNANAKKDAKLLLNQLFIAKKKNLSVIV